MEIILAESAGFCFGVKRAVDCVYEKLKEDKIYTYGPIIHNKNVTNDLKKLGVDILDKLEKDIDGKVIIRSHGVPYETYEFLENNNIEYVDCTCPYVKKIHNIVKKEFFDNNKTIIIIGSKEHPEIIGINGWCGNSATIVNSLDEFLNIKFEKDKRYTLVFQTTFDTTISEKIINSIPQEIDLTVCNTICSATNDRQKEAIEIAKVVDYMIILGDTSSSNTQKLYEISKKFCQKTFLCERIQDLELNNLSKNVKIGITAGASTPPDIIKEALNKMNEIENLSFEEMLNQSFKTLRNGEIVTGTVISVTENEVFVNIGYKSDGIIEKNEFSNEENVDLKSQVKPGDEIEVFVLKVNDGEGNVLLSKKRLEMNKIYDQFEDAFNNKTVLKGTIVDVIKGGLVANINNARIFVPSSQISNKFVKNLNEFKGQDLDFNIIEFNKQKRRVIAGRKELVEARENEVKEQVFSKVSVGEKVQGVVNRIVDFGAFVDLGGVDGLIHISQLSWGRVEDIREILKEGDTVTAVVLEADKEKNKISLTLKTPENNPWNFIEEKYKVGSIIEGKVARFVPFGTFVVIEPGIDGLVHISQISSEHIEKPEDALTIGQVVSAKVLEVSKDNKKINLSIKEAKA